MYDTLHLHRRYSPWNSPGQNNGGGSLSLLQGIFPIQESTQGLLHCRRFLYQLCYHRSPAIEQASKLDYIQGILGGSDSKESTWDAGDPYSIPGSGRSPGVEMATHSSILAWRIPWTEEPGGLQSMGSQRVGDDWTWLDMTEDDWMANTFSFFQYIYILLDA